MSAARDLGARAVEEDIRRELEAHLRLSADDALAAGAEPGAAQHEALARFGDLETVVAACRYEKRKELIWMQRMSLTFVAILAVAVAFLAAQTLALRNDTREMLDVVHAQFATISDMNTLNTIGTLGSLLAEDEESRAILRPEEIVIQVGDLLELVELDYSTSLSGTQLRVGRDGMVLLPEIGWFPVAGLSRPELEEQLTEAYNVYYESVRLCVRVNE